MMLPDSIRRKAANTAAMREKALLDNFAIVREIEAGVPPDLTEDPDAWLDSAHRMGLTTKLKFADHERAIWVVRREEVTLAHLWVVTEGMSAIKPARMKLYPTDNRLPTAVPYRPSDPRSYNPRI